MKSSFCVVILAYLGGVAAGLGCNEALPVTARWVLVALGWVAVGWASYIAGRWRG
jgi:hypothetical protein